MNDTHIHLPNDHIVCLPIGRSFLNGICAFTQGKIVSATGVIEAIIKRELQDLDGHGCRICESFPLSGDNDPDSQWFLKVNHVGGTVCKGLCPSKHYHALLQSSADGSRFLLNSIYILES